MRQEMPLRVQQKPPLGVHTSPWAGLWAIPWAGPVLLTLEIGVVYFLAARLSLALLTKPEGVAVFWPAAGVSAGVLIALGPRARWPVIVGTIAATILANLLGDRNLGGAVLFALCNAGEAVLAAWFIGRFFGADFTLSKLGDVMGLVAAAILRPPCQASVGRSRSGCFTARRRRC